MPEESPTEPRPQPRPPRRRGSRAGILVVGGPIGRSDLPGLERRVRTIAAASAVGLIECDVSQLVGADAAAVDTLARLQVVALRHGRRIRLVHASAELRGLLACMGLADALPVDDCAGDRRTGAVEPLARGDRSGRRRGRQAEEREQARRVEEEADPHDPPA